MLIFDCDGVLVDSELIANRLLRRALARIGLEFTLEETIDRFMGRSADECIREIERQVAGTVDPAFWTDLQEETWRAFDRELEPIPGIHDALDAISCDYCVASSGSYDKMHRTLGKTGLLDLFEGRMFSVVDVSRGKPWPDLFLHAASQMGYRADDCTVVEDSEPGVKAGLAAGMRVLGFCRTTPTDKLAKHGVVTFTDMTELPGLLKP